LDDNYHIYLNRVVKLGVPGTYQTQVQNIQESYKFKPDANGQRQPAYFPGYTVIAPPWQDDPDNGDFYARLQQCQQELVEKLDPGLFVTVPPESFHLTLADVIWDNAYLHACQNPDFEVKLRSSFEDIFAECGQLLKSNHPIEWQVLGMMMMPRALGVCLVPKDEAGYERLLEFRRLIYQNSGLMALGIEQQYSFTAHITLGYFGAITDGINRDRICKTLVEINDNFIEKPPALFCCKRAELRKFEDMTNYHRQSDWPSFQF
jgi:hypothetical protein